MTMTNRSIAVLLLFIVLLLSVSCKKKPKEQEIQDYVIEQEQSTKLESQIQITTLNAPSQELVKNWSEYQEVKTLVERYQSISKTDALLNSVELSEKAELLKDSIRVAKLDIPSVRMRLNVFHSEVKRLEDMSTIPGISDDAVLEENIKVLEAFDALNRKINNMNRQEMINKQLGDFIDEVVKESDSLEP